MIVIGMVQMHMRRSEMARLVMKMFCVVSRALSSNISDNNLNIQSVWEDSDWFINTATNRKAPSELVCLPQSELCCILRAGQLELRRQQSEIPKRHFKTKRLPSNKRRHFFEFLFMRFYYSVSK